MSIWARVGVLVVGLCAFATVGVGLPRSANAQIPRDSLLQVLRSRLQHGADDYIQLAYDSNPPLFRGVVFARGTSLGQGANHSAVSIGVVVSGPRAVFVSRPEDLSQLVVLGGALASPESFATVAAWLDLLKLTAVAGGDAAIVGAAGELPAGQRSWYSPQSALAQLRPPSVERRSAAVRATFFVREGSALRRFECSYSEADGIRVAETTLARFAVTP